MPKYIYKYMYDCPPDEMVSKEYTNKKKCLQACVASILKDAYGTAWCIRVEDTAGNVVYTMPDLSICDCSGPIISLSQAMCI